MKLSPSSKRRPRRADVARYCACENKSRAALEAVAVVAVRRLCRVAVQRLGAPCRRQEAAAA